MYSASAPACASQKRRGDIALPLQGPQHQLVFVLLPPGQGKELALAEQEEIAVARIPEGEAVFPQQGGHQGGAPAPAELPVYLPASVLHPAGHVPIRLPGKDAEQLAHRFGSDAPSLGHAAHTVAEHGQQPLLLHGLHSGKAEGVLLFLAHADAL